jgi:superfamily II DNA/RNA helicase
MEFVVNRNYLLQFYRLVKLLEDIMDGSRILVFLDTKKGCDQITRQLRMDGWPALSIHGDKSQAERDWVLSEFRSGKSPIMTATDVAARGLGTKSFSHLRANINSLNHGDKLTTVLFVLNRRERCEVCDKL